MAEVAVVDAVVVVAAVVDVVADVVGLQPWLVVVVVVAAAGACAALGLVVAGEVAPEVALASSVVVAATLRSPGSNPEINHI